MDREQMDRELAELRKVQALPGWEVILQLLIKACQRKEVEKSNRLRRGNMNEAVLMQGEIDGIKNTPIIIENYIKTLLPEENFGETR